jgi:uncharacterized protein YegP (UPF0339 family)
LSFSFSLSGHIPGNPQAVEDLEARLVRDLKVAADAVAREGGTCGGQFTGQQLGPVSITGTTVGRHHYAELFRDVVGAWRFRIIGANGEYIAQSEAYLRKIDAHQTALILAYDVREAEPTFGEQMKDGAAGTQVVGDQGPELVTGNDVYTGKGEGDGAEEG